MTWKRRLRKFGPTGILAAALLLLLLLAALGGPVIMRVSADAMRPQFGLQPPSTGHLFGTDELGRDILARVLQGGRISIGASLLIVALALSLGAMVGVVSGLCGGVIDLVLMRIADIFLAFPPLLLAMAVAAALGAGLQNALLAIVAVWWAGYARLARGQAIAVRELQYVAAARTLGSGFWRLVFKHVLPNIQAPLMVKATTDIGFAVLTLASLSFIGLGAQPPTPEWGAMIASGRTYILDYWWYPFFPGVAIFLCVLSSALLGDAIRAVMDPRSV